MFTIGEKLVNFLLLFFIVDGNLGHCFYPLSVSNFPLSINCPSHYSYEIRICVKQSRATSFLVLQVLWLERNNLTHAPPIPVVSKEALVFATEYWNSNTGKVRKSEMLMWQKSNVHDPGEGTGREEGEQGPVPEKWS